jgi:hypothetical protein
MTDTTPTPIQSGHILQVNLIEPNYGFRQFLIFPRSRSRQTSEGAVAPSYPFSPYCQENVARLQAGCYRARMSRKSRAKPPSPFRYFHSAPEVIREVVMLYVRFPLSLRNVEDLLFERGYDLCHETVRLWWNRFGPLFASEIRRKRINHMRGFRHWK